jgi:hypothetical protein
MAQDPLNVTMVMFDLLMDSRKPKEEWKFVLTATGPWLVIAAVTGTVLQLAKYASNWDFQWKVCIVHMHASFCILVVVSIIYYMPPPFYAVFEFLSGSPFGSNYQLPLVGVSCRSGASNISECRIYNQTSYCNHRRTVGVLCKGKSLQHDNLQSISNRI